MEKHLSILKTFQAISVSDLQKVALMSRTDTKYLLSREQLPKLLLNLKKSYSVLDIDGQRLFQYNTTYFDSNDFSLYHMHQNGKLNRFKIRSRSYTDSDLHFNEIKLKSNTGNTDKSRITRNTACETIDVTFEAFIKDKSPITPNDLSQKTMVNFKRLTLVDHNFTERITIDVDLQTSSKNSNANFEKLVILELKRDKSNKHSHAEQMLRDLRIFKQSCSKYCLAVGTLYKNVKKNKIKALQRKVEKIQKGQLTYEYH